MIVPTPTQRREECENDDCGGEPECYGKSHRIYGYCSRTTAVGDRLCAMATLWVVATPIGNLDDMTFRGVETLRRADLVVCEDTRQTQKLLTHFQISSPTTAFHAHTDDRRLEDLIARIGSLERVALVTDAGTPGVSDPGAALVQACVGAGIDVRPVPGVSALTALLSVAGPLGRTVLFDGFPSPKPGRRRRRIRELCERGEPYVFYESPHRIVKLLHDIEREHPGAEVVVGREMTKVFEEFFRGGAGEIADILNSRGRIRGELTVLVRTADNR